MNKRFIHIAFLIFLSAAVLGQFQPLIDQPRLHGLAINPAYAGSQEALNVGIHSRIQWVGFEGAPRTHALSLHAPMRNKKVSLGLVVMGDRSGSK
ncbi:MAG: type IX secretion system membrane protein PorP/SprF, partial [Bacteroidetes bacterium]|nr:type IX secretion system membrane protein PorP/SprF [Bacteroidota bacterium]